MWSSRFLSRIDFRVIPLILILMAVSLTIIASVTSSRIEGQEEFFFTYEVRKQLQWFAIGWGLFFLFAGFDYNKMREWTWFFYAITVLLLAGLFFTEPIQHVRRWYRIPFFNMSFQPSEYAKLFVVITLSWFLEKKEGRLQDWSTAFFGFLIVGVPFLLILKQPDLGTALVLFPITLVMFYFGGLRPSVTHTMIAIAAASLCCIALIFLGVVSHEEIKPYATKFLKSYQFERLNPNTHHQKAAATAIAVGGLTGTGWGQSEYTGGGWLPAAETDSVFPAFGELYGFVGLVLLLVVFYALIYFSFQVTAVAGDPFGRLLSAGVTVYLAMHILVNVGMMCGLLPITGVPLVLVSYGGSSVMSTMTALGILQSIYSRRFMF